MVSAAKPDGISPKLRSLIAGAARAELARRSLHAFLVQSWHIHEPGVPFEDNWHIRAFCDHVQWMLEGWLVANDKGTDAMRARVIASWEAHGLVYQPGELLVQNMVWNLAPATLKSRILMVVAPSWMWLHDPTWSLCAISAVADNVKRDSNGHRDVITSAWYRQTFGIAWRIRRDNDSVHQWKTTAGGERKSITMLSKLVGLHVNCLLMDDPDDANGVWNETARRAVQDAWTRSIKNRLKDPDRDIRIAIQQRVHIDDWTAAQINKGQWSPEDRKAWAWMAIPVLYGRGPRESARVSPWGWTDPRSAANENMHETRFSAAMIADEERDRGPEGFEAQYNQNPDRFDGGMIPRSLVRFFRIEDHPVSHRARPAGCGMKPDSREPEDAYVLKLNAAGEPELDWLTMTIDCSNGSEAVTASQVGILVVGGRGLERFIFDDRTAIMSIDDMYEAIKGAIRDWPVKKVLIEAAAAGSSVIRELKVQLASGELRGHDGQSIAVEIVAIKTGGESGRDSKEGRAAAMRPAWRMGHVYVLDGAAWLYPVVADGGKVLDQGFVGEICSFPRSKKNDRVDALSQLMTYYRATRDTKAAWRAMSRR